MSFGFGVGDFLTVIELARKIRREFSDAPSQFKDISDEIRSLSIILQDVDILLERELSDQQTKDLTEIASSCRHVLEKLEQTLDKYGDLQQRPHDPGRKIIRVWKRLKWEPDDIRDLRSRVVANITLLNAFQGTLTNQTSAATKAGVDRLNERQDDRDLLEEKLAILEWLTPFDYASQQSDFISRRQAGTGQWFLDSIEFQQWLRDGGQTLFCPGMPGAGKTILTSVVIEYLQAQFENDSSVGIAYIYCNFRRRGEQTARDLLANLLRQLTQGRSSPPETLKSAYKRYFNKGTRTQLALREIAKELQAVAALYSRIFVIVDALDECQPLEDCRRTLLSEIFSLKTNHGANIFATSRPLPEITEKFEESIALEIRASEDDVRTYVDGRMSSLPSFVSRNPDLQQEIKTRIVQSVEGMFLLAQLHLDSLVGKISTRAIGNALIKLPTGSEAYEQAYHDAMIRIESQISDQTQLAKRVLSWITCARRPLTALELQHALGVEATDTELDKENLPQFEDMVSVCMGLVTIEGSGVIRLVHYTTQNYLEKTQDSWFPNAEIDIARTCAVYLSFREFERGFCNTDQKFEQRLTSNPLYDYAANYWGHHARKAPVLPGEVIDFLQCDSKAEASSQALIADRQVSLDYYRQRHPARRQMAGLHLAAYFGIDEAGNALLECGKQPDLKDSYGWTPLLLAAEGGHEAIVQLLLEKKADANSTTKWGQTALSIAAAGGHEAIVQQLLESGEVDVDSRDQYGRTALSYAAARGCEPVIELLLKYDQVDVDSEDKFGWTPLSYAAAKGREAAVKLLLESGRVSADSGDKYQRTAVSYAAERGHNTVVNLLLDYGASCLTDNPWDIRQFADNALNTP